MLEEGFLSFPLLGKRESRDGEGERKAEGKIRKVLLGNIVGLGPLFCFLYQTPPLSPPPSEGKKA